MEEIARYKHHIGFINTYVRFNVIPRVFQLKFHSNIPDLQVKKSLRNCSKKLIFKIVSKYNSDIRRILNEVLYHENYLYTFHFDESKKLLDHINFKQLKVFHFLSRVRRSQFVRDGLQAVEYVDNFIRNFQWYRTITT